jgi:uncharacterized protein (DUF486 family)
MIALFVLAAVLVFAMSVVMKFWYGKWKAIPIVLKSFLILSAWGSSLFFCLVEPRIFTPGQKHFAIVAWALFTAVYTVALFAHFREKEEYRRMS